MEQEFIEQLYSKHKELTTQIKSLEYTMRSFSIPLPNYDEHSYQYQAAIERLKEYPKSGTWKEKIYYSLTKIKQPALVSEITDYIAEQEDTDDTKISSIVSQYCPIMFSSGILSREKDGKRYRYTTEEELPF